MMVMTRICKLTVISTLLMLFSVQAYAATLSAQVDRNKITEEETLNLQVRYNEQVAFGKPDFDILKNDFDILSNSQSNQYRSINGQVESYTQWRLMLAPKRTGKLQIPALSFKGVSSQAINVEVLSAGSGSSTASSDKPVFIDSSIDKKQLFVQEQLLYTVRLITSVNLQGLNADELKIPGAVVKQVGENQYQRRINGRNHLVVESVYAIFPQSSGELTIPRLNYTVTLEDMRQDPFGRDPFFKRGGKRLRLHAPEKIIPVMPQPDNYPAATWLPASNLSLEQSWSTAPDQFTVGEPITRTITLTAKGLSAAQLPPLTITEQSGIKYYPDQPQTEDSVSNTGITGIRTESYAIVPTRPGNFTLPAVVVSWWDTEANRIREVSLPVQTIQVAPADGQTAIQPAQPEQIDISNESRQISTSTTNLWLSVAVASIILNIALAGLLFWRWNTSAPAPVTAQASKPNSNEKQAFNAFKASCKGQQPQPVRQALIVWAQQFWQEPGLSSLNQIIGLSDSGTLQSAIAELDAALYQNDEVQAWNANNLLQAVELERKRNMQQRNGKKQADDALPELYN
ncbi:BatD family protein [Maricurvus nonylphenolicus]|uniref:BatD family protein n=1 Tax=Maricurvus nonylphenolicus TaxID=1008307 RepID=UPI0036F37563